MAINRRMALEEIGKEARITKRTMQLDRWDSFLDQGKMKKVKTDKGSASTRCYRNRTKCISTNPNRSPEYESQAITMERDESRNRLPARQTKTLVKQTS
jgi:hypothetical protein